MKKQTGAAQVVITAAVVAQVEDVLAMAAKHKYQASKVYAAHNAVFGLNETPEVCASCNKKRGDALRKWYGEYSMKAINEANAALNAEGQALTGNELPNTANGAQAPGVLTGVTANEISDENKGAKVPRGTFTELEDLYSALLPDDQTSVAYYPGDVESEVKALNWLLAHNTKDDETGETWLSEGEAALVNKRLAEIADANAGFTTEGNPVKPGTVIDMTRKTPYDTVQKIIAAWNVDTEGGELEGLKALLETDATPHNDRNVFWVDLFDSEKALVQARINELSDEEDGPLDLKNKKGEYFQGTFISEDGVNGQLVDLEGNSLKPGTYSTEMGDSYAVQPGGKATYKSDII